MSQIQLQGPQVFAEPSRTPFLYTESATIFPEPRVAVGEGIDIGAIAKGVATLGTTIVDTTMDYQFNKIGESLDNLTYATDAQLKLYAENSDFVSYRNEQAKYKQQVSKMLGFDPEQEETGFLGKREFNLRAQANKALSNFSNNLGVYEQEYRNMVEIDAFTVASNNFEKEIQSFQTPEEQINHINTVVRPNLEKLFREQFGADMFKMDPKAPLSKPKRALARAMEAEWLKLDSTLNQAQRAIESRKEDILEVQTDYARNILNNGTFRLKSGTKKISILDSAIKEQSWEQISQEQQAVINSTAADVLAAREYYVIATTNVLRQAKDVQDQYTVVGPLLSFEDSEYNVDPFSDAAMELIAKVVDNPTMNEFIQFKETLESFNFKAMNTTVEMQKAIRDKAVETRKREAIARVDKAITRLEAIKLSKDPEAAALERSRLAAQVEAELTTLLVQAAPGAMKNYLSDFASAVATGQWNRVTGQLPLTYNISVAGALIGARQDSPPRYAEEWSTYHGLNMNFQKQVLGDLAQGADQYKANIDRLKKEQEERQRLLEILAAETEGRKPNVTGEVTQSDRKKAAFLAIEMATGSSLFDDSGNLKPYNAIFNELSAKGKQSPIPFSLLQETPYWDDIIYSVQNSTNPEQELARLMAPLVRGPKGGGGISWDDIKESRTYTISPPNLDSEQLRAMSQGLQSENPARQKASEALFLMYSKETRDTAIEKMQDESDLIKDPLQANFYNARLSRLRYLNDEYKEENPFTFVNSITIPLEKIVTYDRRRQTLLSLKGQRVSQARSDAIEETQKRGGTVKIDSTRLQEVAPIFEMFDSIYPNIEIGNGTELTADQTTPVNDQLRALLINPTRDSNGLAAASVIDPFILEAIFETEVEHPTLDPKGEDFRDIVKTRVNQKLGRLAWNGTNFVRGYDKTKTTGTFEKTTMPSSLGSKSRVSGIMSLEQIVLNSTPIPEDLSDAATVNTVAAQFFTPGTTAKTMLDLAENKHAMIVAAGGGHRLPAYVHGISKGNQAQLSYRLSVAALNGRTDTASMLAAQAALAVMGEVSSEEEAVAQATKLGNDIRDQLLNGTLKLETESRPSMMTDGVAPTYVLYLGGKEVATMQPNSNSVPEDMRGSPAYRSRLAKMQAKDVIATYNSESFGQDIDQDYTVVTKRDLFISDWLMSQPDSNITIRPYVWSQTPGFKLAHNLWDEAWAFRKKRHTDGTVTVEKVKQVKDYYDENGKFTTTPVWRDYTEVYDPRIFRTTVPKRYATEAKETGKRPTYLGIPMGSVGTYLKQEDVTALGMHMPIELKRQVPDRFVDDPSIATGEEMVYSTDTNFVTTTPEQPQTTFTWSNMQSNQTSLPAGYSELGRKNATLPTFLLSSDKTTTIVEESDPREMTTYTTTYTKYQDPLTKTFKVVQYTTASNPMGIKRFDPVLVFETDDPSKINIGSRVVEEGNVEVEAKKQVENLFNLETEMKALRLSQAVRKEPGMTATPVNPPKTLSEETKKLPNDFDLWQSLWRDFPPFFVDRKTEEEKPSLVVVTDDNRQLVPNPKMFNFWKALWRDFPPLFLPDPSEKVTVPNPRFFNLWKSLWRDFPPLFVER